MNEHPRDVLSQHCRVYEALLEVAEVISRHRDLGELFHDLARRLHPVVHFDFLNLLLYDAQGHKMHLHIVESEQPGRVHSGPDLGPEESPSGWTWQHQEPLVVADYEQEIRFPNIAPVWRGYGMRSGCYLPLTTAQRRLGAICFASRRPGAYDGEDLDWLGQVARQVAVAVDNTLHAGEAQTLQQQLGGERDRLRLLLEINNAVVRHLDRRELFHSIITCLRGTLAHESTSLVLYDQAKHEWRLHALDFPGGRGLLREDLVAPFDQSLASLAFRTGRPTVLRQEDIERFDWPAARARLAEGIRSECLVPLISHGRTVGTLNVGRRTDQDFTPAEIELLEQVAGQIALAVDNALAYGQIAELKDRLAEEKLYLEAEIRTEYRFEEIIGSSPALRRVLHQVEVVAPTDSTVLLQGETGTGKELIARAIHRLSRRRERTFVKINCAAIPTGLLESELFGHEKGAFTGAVAQKVGRFELADQGTLFLDEVGDIPPELQPKLLRVLQEQEFERLGSNQTVHVDVRLIAATNRDLAAMVADRHFREDLYYRLNVFPLTLPALRERSEDIPLLVRYFVQEYSRRLGRQIVSVPARAMDAMVRYGWPGNVRELANFIERSVLLSRGPDLAVATDDLKSAGTPVRQSAATLAEADRKHILDVLDQAGWVIGGPNGAAARLGLKRTTLLSKMQKLGIRRPR
jgi:formate hydrogenlyase transcriptional activator